MTGWHEFDIPGGFAADYACPVIVENDVNAMATGEHRVFHPDVDDLVFVKIGTGVGTGLVLGGRLYRGADGAAGDIGHTRVNGSDTDAPLCRCGNRGCVEAYAGGWAIIRDLAAAGVDVMTMDGLVNAVRSGNLAALEHVRTAAATVGSAVADLVNTVNPRMVVFGGQLAELDDIVLATVREVIYRRSPPLATRQLVITTTGAEDPGVRGLAVLIADHVFAQERVDQIIARSGIEV
jgi:predicted NBD/HSP70 family sugar kinase